MGKKDILSNEYLGNSERFADIFDYYLHDGKGVIKAEDLVELDSKELMAFLDSVKSTYFSKLRDIIKSCSIKMDGRVVYVLLGIENQTALDRSMPVRASLYDAINYTNQIRKIAEKNRTEKLLDEGDDFLSGLKVSDRIVPIITLVVYWNDKEWTGPRNLSDLYLDIPVEIKKYCNDYRLNIISPHDITDFKKFKTEVGDVFEFIKRQNEDNLLAEMQSEHEEDWSMSVESINVINEFTGANIPTDKQEGGKVKMCRATEAIFEQGIEQGVEQGIRAFIEDKLEDNIDDETIIKKLESRFELTEEKAKEYLKQCKETEN
nr:Rpn family recombination-promoting nuclease/putative transposase [uncultured Butyrivibrio sp.]